MIKQIKKHMDGTDVILTYSDSGHYLRNVEDNTIYYCSLDDITTQKEYVEDEQMLESIEYLDEVIANFIKDCVDESIQIN